MHALDSTFSSGFSDRIGLVSNFGLVPVPLDEWMTFFWRLLILVDCLLFFSEMPHSSGLLSLEVAALLVLSLHAGPGGIMQRIEGKRKLLVLQARRNVCSGFGA